MGNNNGLVCPELCMPLVNGMCRCRVVQCCAKHFSRHYHKMLCWCQDQTMSTALRNNYQAKINLSNSNICWCIILKQNYHNYHLTYNSSWREWTVYSWTLKFCKIVWLQIWGKVADFSAVPLRMHEWITTRKPCYRKETMQCSNCSLRFKVRQQ